MMNNLHRLTLLIRTLMCGAIFALVPRVSYSQFIQNDKPNYTPPSPNASALLEYASVPVTLHTGTAEVSVPLGVLKSRKTSVPISISYHASGIKVQDMASSVGLGWTLNAGGVITRIVRGLPDEGPQGYCTRTFTSTFNDIVNLSLGDIDGEPDIYFFNFMGFKGRIVMDPDKNIIPLPEQNLKIAKPNFASTDPKWEITDTNGVKYIFGKTAESREVSNVTRHTQYAPNPPFPDPNPNWQNDNYSCITSWYLSEIQYPFQTDLITFTYFSSGAIYYENYSQSQNSNIEVWDGCGVGYMDPNVLDHINQTTIPAPKYLGTIASPMGYVTFGYGSRQDIPNAKRLTHINIVDFQDVVKSYELLNSNYFVSDDCSTSDCKRLKLDGIIETTGRSNIPYRTFGYSAVNLPSRKSVKYDHWGYYNNNTSPYAIPPSKVYHKLDQTPISFSGADKTPVLDKTTANILRQITNGAGAVQTLYYELNQFNDNGTIKNTGGVRIVKITEDDGTGINGILEKNYKYRLISNPTISSGLNYRNYTYDYEYNFVQECDDPLFGVLQSAITTAIRFSSSAVDLFDISGSHVGYSDVQVEYPNGSKEYYFFTNFTDRPDIVPEFSIPNGYNGINSADFTSLDGPPFVPYGDRSFERGLLKRHVFLTSTGEKVKEIKNDYEFYQASALEAPGVKAIVLAISGPAIWARRGKYKYSHRGFRVTQTTEKVFDKVDQTKRFSKTTSFTYSTIYSTLVKESTTLLNDGSAWKMEYKYPFDYSNPSNIFDFIEASAINSLKSFNIASVPIETTVWVKSTPEGAFKVAESKLVTFKENVEPGITNYTINPYQVFRLAVNSPVTNFDPGKDQRYRLIHTYDSYDNFGKLLQETPQDGLVNKYVWVGNSTIIRSITQSPTNGPHTTTFNHRPMVGLASITDPAGQKTTYEYDNVNRLKLIRDHNNNIVSRYRYHYQNLNEYSSAFEVTGQLKVNLSQNFKALTLEPTGVTSYTWHFGDGQFVTGTSPSVYHVYSSPGYYLVKLTKTNPEYGDSQSVLTIQITN